MQIVNRRSPVVTRTSIRPIGADRGAALVDDAGVPQST